MKSTDEGKNPHYGIHCDETNDTDTSKYELTTRCTRMLHNIYNLFSHS